VNQPGCPWVFRLCNALHTFIFSPSTQEKASLELAPTTLETFSSCDLRRWTMTLTYWLDHTQTHIETHTQPTDYSIRPLKCSAKVLTAPFFGNEILPNTPFTRYRRLSNRLYNRFDNRLYRVNKHPTCCQAGFTTGLTTVWNEHPLFVQQCWTNTHCSFNRLYNRFDNRLYIRYSRLSSRLSNAFDNRFKRVWQPVECL